MRRALALQERGTAQSQLPRCRVAGLRTLAHDEGSQHRNPPLGSGRAREHNGGDTTERWWVMASTLTTRPPLFMAIRRASMVPGRSRDLLRRLLRDHAPDDARYKLAERVVKHLERAGFELDEQGRALQPPPNG